MKKFDYCTVSCSLPSGVSGMLDELKKLGKQGWELVAVSPTDSEASGLEELTAFLKKEIH